MVKRLLVFVIVVVVVGLLASCDFWYSLFGGGDGNGDGVQGITISGTVVPATGVVLTGEGTLIIGLTDTVPTETASTAVWLEGVPPLNKTPGNMVAFEFTDVPRGRLMVVAWVDLNDNALWDTGEPSGTFPDYDVGLRDFQTDYTEATVTLYLDSPPPPEPDEEGELLNGDFNATGWSDWTGQYGMIADWAPHANVPSTGDYLPSWTFVVGVSDWPTQSPIVFSVMAPPSPGYEAGAVDNYVYAAGDLDQTNASGFGTATEQTTTYSVAATSELQVRFKIKMYRGGSAMSPYYEAPLKISVYVGGLRYVLAAYTIAPSGAIAPGEVVAVNTWIDKTIPLSGAICVRDDGTAGSVTLTPGMTIERVSFWGNGWSWETIVDNLDIFE